MMTASKFIKVIRKKGYKRDPMLSSGAVFQKGIRTIHVCGSCAIIVKGDDIKEVPFEGLHAGLNGDSLYYVVDGWLKYVEI